MNDSSPSCSPCHDSALRRAPLSPCRKASPLGINYRRIAELLASGNDEAACRELRSNTPFGGLLAALGDPDAEEACPLCSGDVPFFLSRLLRYLVSARPDIIYSARSEESSRSDKKAAVIGSGPAGLQAAWTLREHGLSVTVFEAASMAGPTLLRAPVQESSSAPARPLPSVPADILGQTTDLLARSGIVFKTSSPQGQTELLALCREYDIVLCACGKGAVLPADHNGRVRENLFAAGTCMKNRKHLGALQAMASARKAALAACLMLENQPLPQGEDDAAASQPAPAGSGRNTAASAGMDGCSLEEIRREAGLCPACTPRPAE